MLIAIVIQSVEYMLGCPNIIIHCIICLSNSYMCLIETWLVVGGLSCVAVLISESLMTYNMALHARFLHVNIIVKTQMVQSRVLLMLSLVIIGLIIMKFYIILLTTGMKYSHKVSKLLR